MERLFWPGVGALAACLTMFSFIPQIVKVARKKSSGDLSLITLLQLAIGVSLWIAYGVYLKDPIIIAANSITLVTLVILLALYFKFLVKK